MLGFRKKYLYLIILNIILILLSIYMYNYLPSYTSIENIFFNLPAINEIPLSMSDAIVSDKITMKIFLFKIIQYILFLDFLIIYIINKGEKKCF